MDIKFFTAREIWEDYNPYLLPLDCSTVYTEQEDNLVKRAVSFTVEATQRSKLLMGMQLFYDKRWADKRAVVLLIPDLESGDINEIVGALVEEGYVVGVPDYAANRTESTSYPAELGYAKYPDCQSKLTVIETDAKATPWYVWCKVMRRAINVLVTLPQVDEERIGVIGIGVGANIAWMLAGTDKRIKALVPICGGGYLWALDRPRFLHDNAPATDMESAFSTGVGAETYARFVTCPTFYITSRVSQTVDVDRAGDIMSFVKTDNSQMLIMSSVGTQITRKAFNAMLSWFRSDITFDEDTSPDYDASFENREGMLYFRFHTGRSADSADVYISYGEPSSAARNWIKLNNPQRTAPHEYILQIPVYEEDELIVAYANFSYSDGNIVSTPVKGIVPSDIGVKASEKKMPSSRILFDSSMDPGIFLAVTNDIIQPDGVLQLRNGPFDIKGITIDKGSLTLCRNSHEMEARDRLSALHFDACSKEERELIVSMYSYPEMKKYSSKVWLKGGDFWQKVLLECSDFKSAENMTLPRFNDTKIMSLVDVNGVLFNNFVWI